MFNIKLFQIFAAAIENALSPRVFFVLALLSTSNMPQYAPIYPNIPFVTPWLPKECNMYRLKLFVQLKVIEQLKDWVSDWPFWLIDLIDLIYWLTDLFYRLIDRFTWLTDWLIDWLSEWVIMWLIYWLIDLLTDWFIDWLIYWLIDWLTDWFIDWLIYWLIDLLIDWVSVWAVINWLLE